MYAPPVTATGLPLLKWVGGKTRMLPSVLPHYDGQRRIVEPFFGGGALSFHLTAADPTLEVVANDKLTALIGIYEAVRRDPEGFLERVEAYAAPYLALQGKDARRAEYYRVRELYMTEQIDEPEALFFMLWCAYSGLYRTGKTYPGRFNTPHGFGKEKPGFYHPDRIRGAAPVMAGWDLRSGDFADLLDAVDGDSFVFLDPPYRETYGGYTGDGFTEADQLRVVDFFRAADARGAKVVYTNKELGDSFYEEHFEGYTIARTSIRYSVNRDCTTNGRPESLEVVISNR